MLGEPGQAKDGDEISLSSQIAVALEGAGLGSGVAHRLRDPGCSPGGDTAAGLRAVLCPWRGEAREGAAASRGGGLPVQGPQKSGRTGRGTEWRRRQYPKTNPGSRSRRLRPTSPVLPRRGMLAGPGPPCPARLPRPGPERGTERGLSARRGSGAARAGARGRCARSEEPLRRRARRRRGGATAAALGEPRARGRL